MTATDPKLDKMKSSSSQEWTFLSEPISTETSQVSETLLATIPNTTTAAPCNDTGSSPTSSNILSPIHTATADNVTVSDANAIASQRRMHSEQQSFPSTTRTVHDMDSTHSSLLSSTTSIGVSSISSLAEPLTWREARLQLKKVLQNYLDSVPPLCTKEDTKIHHDGEGLFQCKKLMEWWFEKDLDCYFGSILISAVLLVLSVVFDSLNDKDDTPDAIRTLHKSHIAVSVLFLSGSILSVYLLEQRRKTTTRGVETKKRDIVQSFLPVLDELERKAMEEDETQEGDNRKPSNPTNTTSNNVGVDIPGTSLTDVYPCYRLSPEGGKWIPMSSLLLVEGDFIALQLGDTAPADCKMLTGGKLGSAPTVSSESLKAHSQPNLRSTYSATNLKAFAPREPILIKAGERVEPPHRVRGDHHNPRANAQVCDPLFHAGKSSLPRHSRKLLHFNNHLRIYQLLETPIESFLKKEIVPPKTAQLHRQLKSIRATLYVFSIIILALSYIAIFIRSSSTTVDLKQSISLPLFASLSSLPVTSPIIVILLEICGTSRILITVHSYSNAVREYSSKFRLFFRYAVRGLYSRLKIRCFCSSKIEDSGLIDFPIASAGLLERLGVVTVLAIIDDELACDPNSIPQQLLLPTNNGMKLLDLFPKYEEDEMEDYSEDDEGKESKRRTESFGSNHDSDSDWGDPENPPEEKHGYNRRLKVLAKMRKRYRYQGRSTRRSVIENSKKTSDEVLFEDPTWWHHLPSLKCIGLTSLIVDNIEGEEKSVLSNSTIPAPIGEDLPTRKKYLSGMAELALTQHISKRYERSHLKKLAQCIGFSTEPNSFGAKGDITPFVELRRIRIIASRLQNQRILLDRHQISLEESRTWGVLRPDAVSVIIEDQRSHAYQLLTVGDARLLTEFCSDSWIGEDSTITPLSQADKKTILETSKIWSLADLDVQAFSYAPLSVSKMSKDQNQNNKMTYLLDNRISCHVPTTIHKDHVSEDWSLMKNQFFLGLLGSAATPRKDVAPLIDDCTSAGVRFVYFSPRNMRRTKELAGQMSIDISWNCAISLRPLDEGEREDKHRMLSEYADWDVNAKLPHGVQDVKKHLKEVDNVPLLVSLYTDATKQSTREMVQVFKEYHDTVLSVGLAHVSNNEDTFSYSDLAFSYDISSKEEMNTESVHVLSDLHPNEISFVSKIASHSCVFHLTLGEKGLLNMNDIIRKGRSARISVKNAGLFCVSASISFSLGIFISTLTALVSVPLIPGTAVLLYNIVIVPIITLSIAFTVCDDKCMTIVPPKNDESITFGKGERRRMTQNFLLKAIVPALASYIAYLISFGSIAIEFDIEIISNLCNLGSSLNNSWIDITTCRALEDYVGAASLPASTLMVTELALCMIVQSISFLSGNAPVMIINPFKKNIVWVCMSLLSIIILIFHLVAVLDDGILDAIPWYFYFLTCFIFPSLCLLVAELVKKRAKKFEERAEMLRRLQFETKLGMWSPK